MLLGGAASNATFKLFLRYICIQVKTITFIFSFFYLLSSIGYGLEIHYCLGKVSDVSYILFDAHCPCDASHDAATALTCCEDREFFNQIEEEHSVPATPVVHAAGMALLPTLSLDTDPQLQQPTQPLYDVDRGPPLVLDRVVEYVCLVTYG